MTVVGWSVVVALLLWLAASMALWRWSTRHDGEQVGEGGSFLDQVFAEALRRSGAAQERAFAAAKQDKHGPDWQRIEASGLVFCPKCGECAEPDSICDSCGMVL